MNLFNLIAKISLNTKDFEKGVQKAEESGKSMRSQVMTLAHQYKKEGMNMSDAMKKAHEDIEKTAKDAYIAANGSLDGYVSSTKKSADELADNSFPKLGSSIDKFVNKGLMVAGAGLVGFAGLAINTASDLTEVENVTNTVFGDMVGEINEWSKNAISKFGLTELQAKQFTGTLGALLSSSGVTGDAMKDMAIDLTGLSADFSSFYNLSHEEAFEKIRAGILGETEPLKALGINMSVANMEAFALTKGIEKQWKEMSQAEQTTLRYQYIMEQGAMASGDFADTLETSLANQLRVAKNEVVAIAGEIGQKFLPYVLDLVKWIRENKDTIILWVSAILGATLAIKGMLIINTIIGAIKAWTIATQGMTVAQKLLNLVMLANPIGIVVALIGALAGAIIYLWNTNDGFKNALIGAWNSIKNAGMAVWNWLVKFFTVDIPNAIDNVIEFFKKIPQWFSELPYKIGYALGQVFAKIVLWGRDSWNYLVENVPKWINNIVTWFSQLPSRIWEWLKSSANKLINWKNDLITKGREAINSLITTVVNTAKTLPSKILQIGKDVVQGLWNGITSMGSWIKDKVAGFFGGIVDGAKSLLGIKSPSKVFADEVGAMMAKGVGVGFETEMPDINNIVEKSINTDIGINPIEKERSGIIINQTINSKAVLSPLEIAQETLNSQNRMKWRLA